MALRARALRPYTMPFAIRYRLSFIAYRSPSSGSRFCGSRLSVAKRSTARNTTPLIRNTMPVYSDSTLPPEVAMFYLACIACAWRSADADISTCPTCGATLDIRYESAHLPIQAGQPGIWRYAAHLPLHEGAHIVSLGEGGTPLLRSAHLGEAIGLPKLHFKIEGTNPTGSYKDRIAAVGIARLRELGKRAWAATSSGNAGAMIAAYKVTG